MKRPTGYELTALRVDLAASVDQPHLHLEADSDHGLHFSYPAHTLLHGEQVQQVQSHAETLLHSNRIVMEVAYVRIGTET